MFILQLFNTYTCLLQLDISVVYLPPYIQSVLHQPLGTGAKTAKYN